ncbi:MAG: ABC transporter substrate-binding protein [Candidatus Kuenenia sp.]|nr:ABC transporter substrate-binding protein [Candidatus Kuenenia hertensis]
MKNKRFALKLFFFALLLTPFSSLWAGEPGELVMKYVKNGIAILEDETLKGDDKGCERKEKLWAELSPIFNFKEMSQRALGQYWQKLNAEERNEFTRLFTSILRNTYLGETGSYSAKEVVLLKEKEKGKYSIVQTNFILNTGKEAAVEFRLKSNDGNWKIYDVIIEGVSLVNNYRSQFSSILVKSPYSELVKMLKEKIAER